MITNAMLRRAMDEVAKRKGDFTLFALLMRPDAPGSWDLVVSAPWLEAGKLKSTVQLVELLSDRIGEQSLHEFSRIATLAEDNPTVKFFLENLAVDRGGPLHASANDLSDLGIERAIVFRAKKPEGVATGVRLRS